MPQPSASSQVSSRRLRNYQEQLTHNFTSGSARFITANESTNKCLAMIVTETFMEKLNDMFQHEDELDTTETYINRARMDIESIKGSVEKAELTLESATDATQKAEIQQYIDHQQHRLLKLGQRKAELEDHYNSIKDGISLSANYAHYVLKAAMESASLLRKNESSYRPRSDSEDTLKLPTLQPTAPKGSAQVQVSREELEKEEAYENLRDCWYNLEKLRGLFDDKSYLYEKELVEYRQGFEEGFFEESQSDFDRHHLEYGMGLTGALIKAESAFERARERADALGVGSPHSELSCEPRYGEQLRVTTSKLDCSRIEAWRAGVLMDGTDVEVTNMIDDGYHAQLVDISDSTSAKDEGEHRKTIDRWRAECEILRRKFRQTVVDAHLDRRSSA